MYKQRIEFVPTHIAAVHRRCPQSDMVGLPTRVAELHLLQRVTHKRIVE